MLITIDHGYKSCDVNLAIGLPPAHYGAQYERFEQYFDNRNVIDFKLNRKQYSIYINSTPFFAPFNSSS